MSKILQLATSVGSVWQSMDDWRSTTTSERTILLNLEHVSLYFMENDVEQKQVAVFLSVIRATTFELLRDLVALAKPQDKGLKELFETLKSHYDPKLVLVGERYTFYQRNQGPTESVVAYIAELHKLAAMCEFGNFLEDTLRDRLVCSHRDCHS